MTTCFKISNVNGGTWIEVCLYIGSLCFPLNCLFLVTFQHIDHKFSEGIGLHMYGVFSFITFILWSYDTFCSGRKLP